MLEVFAGHRALFRPLLRPAITIGNFDGVHVGHQRLLRATKTAAEALGGDAVAMTFDPHPATFLAPGKVPPRLTSLATKQELLAQFGMNVALIESFDRDFSEISAEDFCTVVLHQILGAKHVVVGHDFRYGKGGLGTTESLQDAGKALGFAVEIIEPVEVDGERASSSRIRHALIAGDLDGANRLLGHPHTVDGPVVRGAGRGRTIGIPTANIDPLDVLLPRAGVYATWVQLLESGQRYMAATNLGTNPTFVDGGGLTLEPHLLDFDGDLYDQRLRVTFVKQLRSEKRFDSLDSLVAQIHSDIQATRDLLQK